MNFLIMNDKYRKFGEKWLLSTRLARGITTRGSACNQINEMQGVFETTVDISKIPGWKSFIVWTQYH